MLVSVAFLLSASFRIFRTFFISPIPRASASRARFSAASACMEEARSEVADVEEGMSEGTGTSGVKSGWRRRLNFFAGGSDCVVVPSVSISISPRNAGSGNGLGEVATSISGSVDGSSV